MFLYVPMISHKHSHLGASPIFKETHWFPVQLWLPGQDLWRAAIECDEKFETHLRLCCWRGKPVNPRINHPHSVYWYFWDVKYCKMIPWMVTGMVFSCLHGDPPNWHRSGPDLGNSWKFLGKKILISKPSSSETAPFSFKRPQRCFRRILEATSGCRASSASSVKRYAPRPSKPWRQEKWIVQLGDGPWTGYPLGI